MYNTKIIDNIGLIFLVSLAICISFINAFPIYILDEAKNSEAAREMLVNGNWFIPTFNDVLRTDKPPLHYFFMMLGYKIFGVNPFGARFFSALFGAMTLTATFYYIKRLATTLLAQITWIVLLSSLFFIQLFHQAVPDPYLIYFVSIALFAFIDFYVNRSCLYLFIFYTFLGLGALSKGPVAIALPGLSVFLFLILKKEYTIKKLLAFRPFLGLFWVFCISFPWYYLAHIKTDGAFTQGFFLDHNINRFGNKMEGHGGPFILTWAFVILGLLPFSVFIIQAFKRGWDQRKDSVHLFALVVVTVFVVFFSISGTKLPNYTMPCYPFLALLIASYFDKIRLEQVENKWIKASLIALLIITIALPIGGFIAMGAESQLKHVQPYSLLLILTLIGSILGYYYFRKANLRMSFLSIAGSWVIMGLLLFGVVYPKLVRSNPVTMAQEFIPKDAAVLVYKRLDAAFPINYDRTFPVTEDLEEIKRFLNENPTGFVISNDRERDTLRFLPQVKIVLDAKALFESHKTLIIQKIKPL